MVVQSIGLNVDVAATVADFAGYQIPSEALIDGLSLKPLLVGAGPIDEAEAAWPRHEFLFEHEGNDIKPFAGKDAGHCTLNWLRPDGGAPSNPTVHGLCSCGNPMQHWISSKNNSYKGLRIINATLNLKLIQYDDDVNFVEMFDIAVDKHEMHNVFRTAPKSQVAYLLSRLAELRGCGANSSVQCP